MEAKEHASCPTAAECDSPTDSGIVNRSSSTDESGSSIDFGVSDIVDAASDIIVAAAPILPGPVAAITGAVGLIKTGCQITRAVREKNSNLKRLLLHLEKRPPHVKSSLLGFRRSRLMSVI
jgi:hypothetical protein